MSNLLEKIKSSGKQRKEVKWPGTDNVIHLRVLNENDHLQSTLAADKLFKETTIALQNIDQYNSELETQYLFRSIEDPESGKQLFPNITSFRDELTPEIKEILATNLDTLHDEYSPDPYKMDDDAFDKIIKDVKKNAKATVGSVSNIHVARRLIIYLAKQRKK